MFRGGDLPWSEVSCPAEAVRSEALAEVERPFDLKGSLVRAVLYRHSDLDFHLLLVQHHAVTDLFTKTLVADHLGRAYDDPDYHPVFGSYEVYRRAERAFLGSPAGTRARDYWAAKLAAGAETLRLPGATWSPQPFTATGRRLPWVLAPGAESGLAALEAGGRPPFLVLLTVYAGLLARLSGQQRFLVGVPLSNRQDLGDLPVPGPTVNILPVLVTVGPGDTFADVYDRVRAEMLGNHRHQRFPFLEVARLAPASDRDPLRPRLLQAGFTSEPPQVPRFAGTETAPVPLDRTGAQMDLFFTCWPSARGWEGYWEYNDASFGPAEVGLWQQAYDRLLGAALDRWDAEVGRVRLADRQDEDRRTGAGRSVPYPLDRSMAALLRDALGAHPDETALVYQGIPTSYRAFGQGVARVAAAVAGAGGRGGRVAVLLDRSPAMVYALHGAVQAGAAYVPLGIDWPEARVTDLLADIEPALVLTQAAYLDRVRASGVRAVLVEDLLGAPGTAPGFPPELPGPDDPMYILYTSGTTGRPKGAELPHAGIVNRLLWMQDAYPLAPGDRCLLKTPYTFDVSGWELFWPFLVGATLVIAEEGAHQDPREILERLAADRVRIVHFVPSMLSHFLDGADLGRASSLTDVVCSGEALTLELVRRFFQRLPGVRLHNLYGPTEASIDVSYWECTPRDLDRGTVPIGWPIANTQIYVLDAQGEPCLPLVRGEIYLGGVGLARGYWRREDLTRERFVPHPFGPGRLYRTGDWGRYGLDGAVEYLERKDNQVKVRGVRVELGEIETHLREFPSVENAVVKKVRFGSGSEGLAAFYVSRTGGDLGASELGAWLRDRLPGTVVPEAYLRLDAFPQSENGKIDRKALPDVVDFAAPAADQPPLAGPEAAVARLWAQVIGRGAVDAQRNFFDAGGNSLGLLTLRTLLEQEFGVTLKVTDLFRNPTVPGMASLARGGEGPAPAPAGLTAADRARLQRQSLGPRNRPGT